MKIQLQQVMEHLPFLTSLRPLAGFVAPSPGVGGSDIAPEVLASFDLNSIAIIGDLANPNLVGFCVATCLCRGVDSKATERERAAES